MSSAAPAARRVLPTMNEDGSRRWIRPKPSHGTWWHRRRIVAYVLMVVFFLIPHLRLFGKPVFLMDLPKREFTLVGYTFLPTDTFLFMLVLASGVISIFLLTALFGRVWCGWACPQTVYLEFLYRPIGRWFDGGYAGSRSLDRKGLFFSPKRLAKYVVFFLLSLFLAHTLLAYFVGTAQLAVWVRRSPFEHPTSFFIMAGATGVMWFNFTYFREQTCLIVCPYGRWQSALLDKQSLIVAYDFNRGEPRAKGLEARQTGRGGDCIDCGACVQTCPTGIDIRNGLQMECVHCTQCMDACDAVMEKLERPKGLIRYTSQSALAGMPLKVLRARVVLYPLVLSAFVGTLLFALATKDTADVTILRAVDAPFSRETDGRIANQIRVKIANRLGDERHYAISVSGVTDDGGANVTVIAPQNPLIVGGRQTGATSLFVLAPASAFHDGKRMISIGIADGHGYTHVFPYELLGPDSDHEHDQATPEKKS